MGDLLASWSPAQIGLALFVAGGFAAAALKLIWGATQWGRKTSHRVGDEMGDARAEVAEWSGHEGMVRADGELWRAVSKETLAPGDDVAIIRIDGLTLEVLKKQ